MNIDEFKDRMAEEFASINVKLLNKIMDKVLDNKTAVVHVDGELLCTIKFDAKGIHSEWGENHE